VGLLGSKGGSFVSGIGDCDSWAGGCASQERSALVNALAFTLLGGRTVEARRLLF
jgi:hypothetical protein